MVPFFEVFIADDLYALLQLHTLCFSNFIHLDAWGSVSTQLTSLTILYPRWGVTCDEDSAPTSSAKSAQCSRDSLVYVLVDEGPIAMVRRERIVGLGASRLLG